MALAAARPHSRLLLVASATNPFDRLSSGIQKAEMHVRAVTDCVKIARVNVTPWRRRKATVRAVSRTVTLAGCAMPAVDGSAYSGRDSRFTPTRRGTAARGFKTVIVF